MMTTLRKRRELSYAIALTALFIFHLPSITIADNSETSQDLTRGDFNGRKIDLGGRLLKVAVEQWKPHVYVTEHPNGSISANGPAPNLLHEASKELNFRYQYIRSVDNTWGSPLPNGTWQGMIGMVMRKEVDMALGPFGLSESRAKVVKFTTPIHIDACRIMLKRPLPVPDPWGFLKPYDIYVWVSILFTFGTVSLVTAYAFVTVDRQVRQNGNFRVESLESLLKSCEYYYSVFFQQTVSWMPKSVSTHLIFGLWILTGLVLARSYSSALTSLLAVRTVPININSLEDIVFKSDLKLLFEANTALSEYLTTAEIGTYGVLAQRQDRISFRKLGELFNSAYKEVYEGTGAMLTEETGLFIVYSESFSQKGVCDFILAREPFWPLQFCLIGPIDSHITDYLNLQIRKLLEAGLYNRWMRDEFSNYTFCAKAPTKFTINEPYNITAMWGMFVMLTAGLSLSFVIFLLEIFVAKIST